MSPKLRPAQVKELAEDVKLCREPFAVTVGEKCAEAFRMTYPRLRAQAVASETGVATMTAVITCDFNPKRREVAVAFQPILPLPKEQRVAAEVPLQTNA